jgi:hypothetical protein
VFAAAAAKYIIIGVFVFKRLTLTLFRVQCHFLVGRLILDEFHQPFLLIDSLPMSWDHSWDTGVVQAYLW